MFKRLLYIFLFLFTGVAAFAQQYPVQGSLAIASPYPANLSDYANSNIQSLALNLTLTDLSMANKRVRLKVFIQTQNATIAQSIDNISGEPLIMLDGGIPQRFTNAELAHYFRLENLQGINPDGYARSLPEGVYTISFEVYDYFTGNKLSGRIGQTFWIIINDPPLLNTPQDKSKIADFLSPSGGAGGGFSSGGTGGIIFNWTPRSSQVSNTEYEFTLCELWDATGDAYQQFMSAIPKYQTTVANTTTLIYSLTQPTLISGYTYAWRVRAKAKAGFEDIGLYRNDGYSNLFTFRYGDPCPAPQSLALETKTSDAIAATWDTPVGGTTGGIRYKIAYRKYSAAGQWSWAETETSDLFLTISNLEPATEYEIKVGVPCNNGNSTASVSSGRGDGGEVVFTPSQRATTLAAGKIAGIECGKEPVIDITNQKLIESLKVGDVVMANDFPTTISSVTGTSQGWSGEAWTKVPWLGDTRIHVTYASIKVNSDYKLIDGSFDTVYNPSGKNIGDVDQTVADISNFVADITTPFVVPDKFTIQYDSIKGTLTFTDANGISIGTTVIPQNTDGIQTLPITLQEKDGKTYEVSQNKDTKLVEVIAYEHPENDKTNQIPVNPVEATQKVKDLVKVLQERIRQHLQTPEQYNLDNETTKYLKWAYQYVDELPDHVKFDINVGGGGQTKDGIMSIGCYNFRNKTSDDDIIATIFHEYLHYLGQKKKENPVLLECGQRVEYDKKMEDHNTFMQRALNQFNFNISMMSKNYPDYYRDLDNDQKNELDKFINDNKLTPRFQPLMFIYVSSNRCKDEMLVYNIVKSINNKGLFSMSSLDIDLYNKKIDYYTINYERSLTFESVNGYTPEGLNKKK